VENLFCNLNVGDKLYKVFPNWKNGGNGFVIKVCTVEKITREYITYIYNNKSIRKKKRTVWFDGWCRTGDIAIRQKSNYMRQVAQDIKDDLKEIERSIALLSNSDNIPYIF
jgi:hypothetical protein